MTVFAPKVSIVIPVYNGANYLREAIDSALGQTYENVEVIVINDGSDDNGKSEKIALSYGDSIRYLHKENGGVASALNAGIKFARGEYISWLSHDDLYYSFKIERQIALFSMMPSSNLIPYSDYVAIDSDSNFIHTIQLSAPRECDSRRSFLYLLFKSSVHGCSLLLPKRCFNEVGYFNEGLKGTQDYDLWFKLLKRGYEFTHIPEVLICSRWHKEQGSRTMYAQHQKEIESLYVNALDMFSDELEKFSAETLVQLAIDFRSRHVRKAANHMLRAIRHHNRVIHRQMYKQYAKPLIQSYLEPITEKPRQLLNLVVNFLKN
jgi:glycosyltransferase involved in cell wall biosynthesis